MKLNNRKSTVLFVFLGWLSGILWADEPTQLVQPQLGYDDIGFAVCKEGTLYLRTFEWQSSRDRKEVDDYEHKVQTRTMKKHQLNPKTGRQELVDIEYEIPLRIRVGKKEVTTNVRESKTENKSRFPAGKYAVITLDGKTLTTKETALQLATERTVLVQKQQYWSEPFPKFEEPFRAILHPKIRIVRIEDESQVKARLRQGVSEAGK